jgi:hypothetical protein
MVGRPDLNRLVAIQVLPGLFLSRFSILRDQVVLRFRRAGHIDSEGDELSHHPNLAVFRFGRYQPHAQLAIVRWLGAWTRPLRRALCL